MYILNFHCQHGPQVHMGNLPTSLALEFIGEILHAEVVVTRKITDCILGVIFLPLFGRLLYHCVL